MSRSVKLVHLAIPEAATNSRIDDIKDEKTHRIVLGAATSVAGLAQNLLL